MLNYTTLYRTLRWFSRYQPDLSNEEGQELYLKLIEEEYDETMHALNNKDLVEFLDGCIDLYWVQEGYKFFGGNNETMNPFELMLGYIKFDGGQLAQEKMLYDLISVVADSNYSKSFELNSKGGKVGKVIKGENFIPPTEGIINIINSYNIQLLK